MGCNCKSGDKNITQEDLDRITFTNSLFMRLILFVLAVGIVGLLIIPVVIPAMIIILFNRIVMSRNTNVNGAMLWIGKKLKTSKKRDEEDEEEDDDEEYDGEDINPEDYELMDVDVIK